MMKDREMTEMLKELDRVEASPGFTERLMSRLDDLDDPANRREWTKRWLTAATIILALGAGFGIGLGMKAERETTLTLLEEQAAIESELKRLEETTSGFDPVIELGHEDGVRYVLELEPEQVEPQFASIDMTY